MQRLKRTSAVLVALLLILAMCCQTAFADTDPKAGFQEEILSTYTALRTIGLGAAALSVALCGVLMIAGSEKAAEKAKTAIKYILLAVVVLFLLPAFIRFGKKAFSSLAWSPKNLK